MHAAHCCAAQMSHQIFGLRPIVPHGTDALPKESAPFPAGRKRDEMTTQTEYHIPDFDEIHAYERRAHEMRAKECARLVRAGLTWLRDALHIGGHHHGHPAH